MSGIDRRQFLAGAGALTALPAARQRSGLTRGAAQQSPFEWGVASFDPTDETVLLWTRVAPGTEPVRLSWVLARDPDLADVVASGRVEVGAASDHCAVVEATGLPPGGTWWYGFTNEADVRSPVGRTRTMPRETVDRLRLGVVSCGRFASGGFAAYRALAEREVDLVVHLGDYIYDDGRGGVRTHEPPERLLTLRQYRARYAQHRADPDLQALHARHPVVAVWDDHEISSNAWRDGAADHDPAVDGPWLARLLAAAQAHEEWLPGRTSRNAADGRLRAWRSLSLGGLAELVVLDTRSWARDRQPTTAAEVGGPAPGGPPGSARTMLGDDQAAFVAERLQPPGHPAERRPWTVLASQVMFHPLRVPVPGESFIDSIEAAGFLVLDGEATNPDQWDGYPQAREQLSVAMGGQGGVVVVTGDAHSSWAWEGPANDGGQPVMVELVAPSVSSESLADRLPVPAGVVESVLSGLDDDLSYVELSSHGYLLVDLDETRVQGEWWYVDPADPATHRFGAARQAPITVPMHLTTVVEPTRDPAPTTTTPTSTTTTAAGPTTSDVSDDGGLPLRTIGVGAGVAAAALGAAMALRRRAR